MPLYRPMSRCGEGRTSRIWPLSFSPLLQFHPFGGPALPPSYVPLHPDRLQFNFDPIRILCGPVVLSNRPCGNVVIIVAAAVTISGAACSSFPAAPKITPALTFSTRRQKNPKATGFLTIVSKPSQIIAPKAVAPARHVLHPRIAAESQSHGLTALRAPQLGPLGRWLRARTGVFDVVSGTGSVGIAEMFSSISKQQKVILIIAVRNRAATGGRRVGVRALGRTLKYCTASSLGA